MNWVLLFEIICLIAIIYQDFSSRLISIWLIILMGLIVTALSWSGLQNKFWIPDLIPLAIMALSSSWIFFRKKLSPSGSADAILVALLCLRWSLDISLFVFMLSGIAGITFFLISRSSNPKIPYAAWLSIIWIFAEGLLFWGDDIFF